VWNAEQPWRQQGSYVEQVPAPAAHPSDAPQVCVSFNKEWLPYVLGSLFQLCQPSSWAVADDAARSAVLLDAQELLFRVGDAGECPMLVLGCDPDTGLGRYSNDGGVSWLPVPACFTNGVTPELRWSGCLWQVSSDGGATWANLSGFDITTLQGCLSGTPGNPRGVAVNQRACDIATYLSNNVFKVAVQKMYDEVNAGHTLLSIVDACVGVIIAADLVLGLAVAGFAAGANIMLGGTLSDYSTALSTASLWLSIQCAIYNVILTDGMVTAANFAAMRTAVNAIAWPHTDVQGTVMALIDGLGASGIMALQTPGSAAIGDCSTCGSFCQEFDFTASNGGWANYIGSGTPNWGTYVAAAGWESVNNSGVMNLNIEKLLPAAAIVTKIRIHVVDANAAGGQARQINLQSVAGHGASNLTSANFVYVSTTAGVDLWEATLTPTACSYIVLYWRTNGVHPAAIISKLQIKGNGPNPFGIDNCTF
jgi:hypothetical protein